MPLSRSNEPGYRDDPACGGRGLVLGERGDLARIDPAELSATAAALEGLSDSALGWLAAVLLVPLILLPPLPTL